MNIAHDITGDYCSGIFTASMPFMSLKTDDSRDKIAVAADS